MRAESRPSAGRLQMKRPATRRKAAIAAAVTVLCALAGTIGATTGAQAATAPAHVAHALISHAQRATAPASSSEITLGALAFDGNGGLATSTVGNGGRLVLEGAYGVRWTGDQAAPRVSLQRRIGSGRWTTTAATVSLTDEGLVVRTPAYSTTAGSQTVSYRLRSAAYATPTNAVRNTSLSKSVRIVYEDQARYTGLARTIYRTVRPYCPATAVHVGSLSEKAGDYRTGALLIRVAGEVRRYRAIDLRAVALHECSHERQWLSYGGTTAGWSAMKADAARVFADWTRPAGATTPYPYQRPSADITPVEHAADCGAQAVNRGGYLGYGGYCTPGELRAAKRLLLGHRY